MDYSGYPVKPLSVRDFTRLIWHTQLTTQNGSDFFNEIFDAHPNLLAVPSIMFDSIEETVAKIEVVLKGCANIRDAVKSLPGWGVKTVEELYLLRDRTDKDILVAMFLNDESGTSFLDKTARIAPAVFFQPHFSNRPGGGGAVQRQGHPQLQAGALHGLRTAENCVGEPEIRGRGTSCGKPRARDTATIF